MEWKKRAAVFLFGQGVSLFGSQIVQMAVIWHVAMQTSSGMWVTILTLSSFLPHMLISPIAGVWADRYNRKTIMIVADGGGDNSLACIIPYVERVWY